MSPRRPVGGTTPFSRRIARARLTQKLSAQQLADLAGVAKNTIYSWERGETIPQRGRLTVLAEVLHMDVDELETLIAEQPKAPNQSTVSTVTSTLPVGTNVVAGAHFVLEISGIRVNVPVQNVPIYVRVAIGPIESEVTREPHRT